MRSRDDRRYLQTEDRDVFPGEIYRKVILEPLFVDARDVMLDSMMRIHYAHGVMLAEEGIISLDEMSLLLNTLTHLAEEIDWRSTEYDPRYEDLFFQLENELISRVGEKIAGQLHTGRSRNDIDATLFRMILREKLLALADQCIDFRQVILELAEENVETLILGYTHTQPAQPTTLGHYLVAVLNFLQRDFERMQEYYKRLNLSPMGAGALTTTSFPINRESVSSYLGFAGVLENSYDCIAGADYLAEGSNLLVVMMTSLSRVLYDFMLYVMEEFNYLKLSDAYVQVSSIMPQKRNPVSLEHSRAVTTGVLGLAQVVITMLTNTPFGDVVDKEQELQRYLWQAWERAIQLYRLLTVVFKGMEFNKELLKKRTVESYAVVTQLADMIVQSSTDISFKSAHRIVSRVVNKALKDGLMVTQITGEMVNQMSVEVLGRSSRLTDKMVSTALDPVNFIQTRKITGGPAFKVVRDQLHRCRGIWKKDEQWLSYRWDELAEKEKMLDAKVQELCKQKMPD